MGGAQAQHIDVLRSLGLLSRSGHRHVSIPSLFKHSKGKDMAVLLTLLGAGTMGAFFAMRYISGLPVPITFSWTGADHRKASSDRTKRNQGAVELTVAGLQNMGNNCFLNVVLQALASSEILVSFIEECARVIDTQEMQAERASMPLAAAVADLLKELSQGQIARRILNPRRVMSALNLYNRQFDLSMQQDAAEALAHLAAALQDERDRYLDLRRPVSQSFGTVLDEDSAIPQLDQSWLHWPLEGTLGSLMVCQRCDFQYSTQFEYFSNIPLPLSGQADGNMIFSCTLEDCLDRYTAPEWVDVKCSHCAHLEARQALRIIMDRRRLSASQEQLDVHGIERMIEIVEKCSCDDDCSCESLVHNHGGSWSPVQTNASKRLRIGRSPEVLCLQLQRAAMNELGEPRKLTGHVKFPTILDLFPYTVTGQDINIKIRNPDTRTQEQGDPLIQMLGPGGVMLSHIRKLQGSAYPSSLFPLDPGIKGGSDLSKQSGPVDSTYEMVSTGVPSEEGLDPLRDQGAPNIVNPSEITEAGDMRTFKSDETLKMDSTDTSKLEKIPPSHPFCSGLAALADQDTGSTTQPASERSPPSRKLLYELLSVVVHHGGAQSGHYDIYRKVRLPRDKATIAEGEVEKSSHLPVIIESEEEEEDKETVVWFKVSDTNVRRVEELEVLLANASILLYERLRSTS